MKLFDFVKIIFQQSDEYEKLTYFERSKFRFMIQRFMSINHPTVAQLLNRNGTNPTYVNDSFRLIGRQYKRTPRWVFTKVRQKKKEDEYSPSPEVIALYLKVKKATYQDYRDLLKSRKRDRLLQELKEFENKVNMDGQ